MSKDYNQMVADFNRASGANYSAGINFLKFRRTRRGIIVGWYAAKPGEIAELCQAVCKAGRPYYAKVNGRAIESEYFWVVAK